MARIIYTALVQQIAGTIAGTTFQRNAYGFTIKKKPNIVNPNRPRQQARKANMQLLAQQWSTLTQVQRDAWAAYAIAHPVPSRLNPLSNLSGHAIWLRVNLLRMTLGIGILATITNTNTDTLFPGSPEVQRVGAVLNYNDDSDSTLNNMYVMAYISPNIKVTQQYDRSATRFMGGFQLASLDAINITTEYTSQFGSLPVAGSYVFLKRVYLNFTNGQVIEYPPSNIQVV